MNFQKSYFRNKSFRERSKALFYGNQIRIYDFWHVVSFECQSLSFETQVKFYFPP